MRRDVGTATNVISDPPKNHVCDKLHKRQNIIRRQTSHAINMATNVICNKHNKVTKVTCDKHNKRHNVINVRIAFFITYTLMNTN